MMLMNLRTLPSADVLPMKLIRLQVEIEEIHAELKSSHCVSEERKAELLSRLQSLQGELHQAQSQQIGQNSGKLKAI